MAMTAEAIEGAIAIQSSVIAALARALIDRGLLNAEDYREAVDEAMDRHPGAALNGPLVAILRAAPRTER